MLRYLAISYYWVCVCLRNVNTFVTACMGDFFSLCIFAIMSLYISLCSSWGIWYQETAKGLYSFVWRDVYLFCTIIFYIFVLSFLYLCLSLSVDWKEACHQLLPKRTQKNFLYLYLSEESDSRKPPFLNFTFSQLQNGTIRQLQNVRNGGIYKEEHSKKTAWLANIFFQFIRRMKVDVVCPVESFMFVSQWKSIIWRGHTLVVVGSAGHVMCGNW